MCRCVYRQLSSTCSLRARSLPLFWPCLPVRPWVRGGVRGFPEEAPIESVFAHPGHSARRTAPCAICSVFIDIYKLYVAGFPLCALVTACCGCLETASYPPPPRQALGTCSSHAPHTLLTRSSHAPHTLLTRSSHAPHTLLTLSLIHISEPTRRS